MDTQETGTCGAATATTRLANKAAPKGSVIKLGNPRSVVNRDRHSRKLRYVVRKSTGVVISPNRSERDPRPVTTARTATTGTLDRTVDQHRQERANQPVPRDETAALGAVATSSGS